MIKQVFFRSVEIVLPERLREARHSRGYSISQLANELGISRQLISKYELGLIDPDRKILDKMVDVLNLPLAFFSKQSNTKKVNGTIFFKSVKSDELGLRDIIKIRLMWMEEVFDEFDKYIKFPKVDLPSLQIDKENLSLEDIEKIVHQIKIEWGSQIKNITRFLESKGFIISYIPNALEIESSSQIRNGKPYILINKGSEEIFNIAHELGHILLHSHISDNELLHNDIFNKVEFEANLFAFYFLSQNKLQIENPIVLKTAVNMLIEHGFKSANDLIDIFKWSSSDLEEICNLPKGMLNKNQIMDFQKKN